MKIHLTAGDIYLDGYTNCDIVGNLVSDYNSDWVNPNSTTLEQYFKRPFVKESSKRNLNPFYIDTKMNILEIWPWADDSVQEIIQINSFEHFWNNNEIPFIVGEAYRVLKRGGIWKFDFPDIKKIVELYHDTDADYCMRLIYGSRKDKYSCHEFGYTKESIKEYFSNLEYEDKWKLEFRDVVIHSYPSQGVWATKI